jgi:hypothetical protein
LIYLEGSVVFGPSNIILIRECELGEGKLLLPFVSPSLKVASLVGLSVIYDKPAKTFLGLMGWRTLDLTNFLENIIFGGL